jgi:hypothetical protein
MLFRDCSLIMAKGGLVFIFLGSLSRNVPPPLNFNVLKIVPPPPEKIMREKCTPPPDNYFLGPRLGAQFYVFKTCFILNIYG